MTVAVDADLLAGLRAVQHRTGVSVSEGIRRAAAAWTRKTWRLSYVAPPDGRGWRGMPVNFWIDQDVWARLKVREHRGTTLVAQLRAAIGDWLQRQDVLPAARGKNGQPIIRFRRTMKVPAPRRRPLKDESFRGMNFD
jgi:hypothetical protein